MKLEIGFILKEKDKEKASSIINEYLERLKNFDSTHEENVKIAKFMCKNI